MHFSAFKPQSLVHEKTEPRISKNTTNELEQG